MVYWWLLNWSINSKKKGKNINYYIFFVISMAKKKEDETTKTEKEDESSVFDWKQAFNELEKPNTFKGGLGYYIETRGLQDKIKTMKDFEKIIEDYSKTPL